MKRSLLATLFLVTLVGSPALAGSLVPGSDHFTEARADAAANSVAFGIRAPIVTSSVSETRSYGYGAGATGGQTYAREPVRVFDTRPGGPGERVALVRPWVGRASDFDPG